MTDIETTDNGLVYYVFDHELQTHRWVYFEEYYPNPQWTRP